MEIINNAAIFPSSKLSNGAPPTRFLSQGSMLFNPMSSNPQKSVLITAKSFSQRPISAKYLFNPILEAHEGSTFLKSMSSTPEKSMLINAKSFSQRPNSVNPLFNPILDAHEDVMRAMPYLGILVSDQPLFNPDGEDFNPDGEDFNPHGEDQEGFLGAKGNSSPAISEKANLLWQIYQRMDAQNQVNGEKISSVDAHEGNKEGQSGPSNGKLYEVLLINYRFHTERKVMEVLPSIIPSMSGHDAREVFYKSRKEGIAVVTTVDNKEAAYSYMKLMRQNGLKGAMRQA